jgi:hypothetical protein
VHVTESYGRENGEVKARLEVPLENIGPDIFSDKFIEDNLMGMEGVRNSYLSVVRLVPAGDPP